MLASRNTDGTASRVAVVPVRDGLIPDGGTGAVAEADGVALLVGEGTAEAAERLPGASVTVWETHGFRPGAWARALADLCSHTTVIILPACPDGRDLAPRLAARLRRPLLANAVELDTESAVLPRDGDRRTVRVGLTGPAVVTMRPKTGDGAESHTVAPVTVREARVEGTGSEVVDAETLAVTRTAPATRDLAEARRLVVGGGGLLEGPDDAATLALLTTVAAELDASVGATGVLTGSGLVPATRQVGTAGVTVSPELYIAVGVSGAVRHLVGIGSAAHVVAVNTDPGCPMMAAADLALVTDAAELLAALARRLGVKTEESTCVAV